MGDRAARGRVGWFPYSHTCTYSCTCACVHACAHVCVSMRTRVRACSLLGIQIRTFLMLGEHTAASAFPGGVFD